MGTLANTIDPDEVLPDAACHQGPYCLLCQNRSSEKEIQYVLDIMTCDPSIYTLNHSDLTASNLIYEKFFDTKRVKQQNDICTKKGLTVFMLLFGWLCSPFIHCVAFDNTCDTVILTFTGHTHLSLDNNIAARTWFS